MFISRVPPVSAVQPAPSATSLRDHDRLQRLLRRTASSIANNIAGHLPGFRGRYRPDRLADAAEAVTPRAGNRQHLEDSPHLGQVVDVYV